MCRRLPAILGRMTAARNDDFMALPGMEADSTDAHHGPERLSDDATPSSASTSPNASSKSALDALLDEYRARATSEREKGTLFGCDSVADTSGTPWGNSFAKVSHPRVRGDSRRRPHCRGVPSYTPANTRPYCRHQTHITHKKHSANRCASNTSHHIIRPLELNQSTHPTS